MCCKKIKDILHPLNIFGKSRTTKVIVVPYIHPGGNTTINIKWTGERMRVLWTFGIYGSGENKYRSEERTYTAGSESTESITIRQSMNNRIVNGRIYFDCTNVTYLEVNGERLI